MNKDHYALMVERLRELVMEDSLANKFVNDHATACLDHFLNHVDMVTDQDVLNELFCQYQVQAWNKLFRDLMP